MDEEVAVGGAGAGYLDGVEAETVSLAVGVEVWGYAEGGDEGVEGGVLGGLILVGLILVVLTLVVWIGLLATLILVTNANIVAILVRVSGFLIVRRVWIVCSSLVSLIAIIRRTLCIWWQIVLIVQVALTRCVLPNASLSIARNNGRGLCAVLSILRTRRVGSLNPCTTLCALPKALAATKSATATTGSLGKRSGNYHHSSEEKKREAHGDQKRGKRNEKPARRGIKTTTTTEQDRVEEKDPYKYQTHEL